MSASPALRLDDIRVVTRRRVAVEPAAFDALAADLGRLPPGYRDYLERFGEGVFCGLLWVHPPSCLIDHRDGDTIQLASSMDGDHVCLDEGDPRLHVRPRHRPPTVVASFEDALAWFASSGAYWTPTPRPWFACERDRFSRALAFDASRLDDARAALVAGAAELGAEVIANAAGHPALAFAPAVDGVIEVFPDAIRVTVEASERAFVVRVGALLTGADIDVALRA